MAAVAGAIVLDPVWGVALWLAAIPLLNLARVAVPLGDELLSSSTVLLVLLGGSVLLDPAWRQRLRSPGIRLVLFAATGVGVIAVASWLTSGGSADGFAVLLHGVLEPLAAFAVVLVVGRVSAWRAIIVGLVIAASLAAVLALYRMLHVAASLAGAQAARADFGHFLFYNVNIFGAILALSLPVSVALAIGMGSGMWRKQLLWLAAAVITIALYFTFSKGAWLGALAGAGFVFFVAARTLARRTLVAVSVCLIALMIVPVPLFLASYLRTPVAPTPTAGPGAPPSPAPSSPAGVIGTYTDILAAVQGTDRLSSWDPASSVGEVSLHERVLAWKAAVSMVVSRPLVGVGPGEYGPNAAGPFHQQGATRALNSAHNYLLNLGAELGLLALVAIIAAILLAVVGARRAYSSREPFGRALGLAIGGALLGFLTVGETTGMDLYASYRIMNSDGILFAIVLAIGIGTFLNRWTIPGQEHE